jgi:hypothetical protein
LLEGAPRAVRTLEEDMMFSKNDRIRPRGRVVKIALGLLVSGAAVMACVGGSPEDETAAMPDEVEEVGEVAQAACVSYDPLIEQARSLIAQNCGVISACGGGDTYTHHDLFLSNQQYCACYDYMWNNRNSSPWNALQVIYHEPGPGCSSPHIHLEKKNTCGVLHFDLDEGKGGGTGMDCWDDEPTADIDEHFCYSGTRKSTCDDLGGGGGCSTAGLPVPNDRWRLKIWDNKTLSGDPVEIRHDAPGSNGFSFQWGTGSPSSCAAPDTFSVAFQRSAYFPSSGNYTFTTTTDDGVKLLVDGALIINAWYDQVATHQVSHYVSAGWHTVRMNYYENLGGAMASLSWAPTGSNPYPSCPCNRPDNYCQHAPSTPGCPMTYPGGYCDPNGDGSYTDADWNLGYYQYQDYCL